MRLSATFDSLWLVRYGSVRDEELCDVCCFREDRIFFLGYTWEVGDSLSPPVSYGYLACVSSDGDTIWERLFGNNVILTTDAFISRDSLSIYCLYRDINEDTLALKITQFSLDGDSIGHARITYNYPSPMVSSYWAMGIDRDDGWMVVGNLNYSSFIAKYNRDTDSVSFDEGVSVYAYRSIEQLNDSIFVVSGNCGARPNRDIMLTWLDYHGDTIRNKVFDIDGDQFARSLHVLPNKNIVICGYTNPPIGITRALAIMVDSLGNDIPGAAIEETPALPAAFEISAHPNPFNSAITITIDGAAICHSRESGNPEVVMALEIFDLNGRRVAQLSDRGTVGAGFTPALNDVADNNERDGARPSPTTCEFTWTPDETVTSGVYLVRARFDDHRSLSGAEATGGTAAAVKRVVYLK